jgi:hypothetical protein
MKPIRWAIVKFPIDGRGLERWCVKTLINIHAEGEYRIGKDSEAVGQPSSRLVRIAFGKETFKPRAGLYGLGAIGENIKSGDGFRVMPYVNRENILVGGLFGIHGYRFLLYLEEEGEAERITMPDFDTGIDYQTQTLYPLKCVNFTLGKHISHSFRFEFPS